MSKNFFRRLFGAKSAKHQHVAASKPTSYRERVTDFWQWFSINEDKLYSSFEDQTLDLDETGAAVDLLHEDMAWEFGDAEEEDHFGFAFSAAGNTTLRLLANYAAQQAPPLKHWTIFTSRQGGEGAFKVELGGEIVDFERFCFGLDFDPSERQLRVSVNHPSFSEIPKDIRQQLMMIALNSALGENFVEAWIGSIEDSADRTPDQKVSWTDLRGQARAAVAVHDHNPDIDPIERWYSYSCETPEDGDVISRADIIAGTSCHIDLVQSFYDPDRGDPLADCGAVFVYLMIPAKGFGEGTETEERARIEDIINQDLQEDASGLLIGGATGQQYVYVDMILFDEARAIETLRATLAAQAGVDAGTLRYFAHAREDERIVIK